MIKTNNKNNNNHVISFWERGKNETELIPICEPTPIQYGGEDKNNTDQRDNETAAVKVKANKKSKKTYNCVRLKSHDIPKPRECRRLLKRGYSWSLCPGAENEPATGGGVDNNDGLKSALDDLLTYKIDFVQQTILNNNSSIDQYPNKCTCYFTRNQTSLALKDNIYLADDRCIILVKFSAPTLKLCYLDLLNGVTYFQKLVLFHTSVELRLCNGFLWLVQKPSISQFSEILYIRPNNSNCIVTRHTLSVPFTSLSAIMEKAVFSSTVILFRAYYKYVLYDAQRHCLQEMNFDIPEIENCTEFYTVGKMFFTVQKSLTNEVSNNVNNDRSRTKPSVFFYTGVFEPVMQLTRKIDITRCLSQHENYLTPSFDVSVHHRGMKALILSEESYIIVLDLLTGKVTQILSYIPCFWQHKLSLQMSPDGNLIKMIGIGHYGDYLCVDFLTWHGNSLKDTCLRHVVRNFDYAMLSKQNLPRAVMRQLDDYFSLRDEILDC